MFVGENWKRKLQSFGNLALIDGVLRGQADTNDFTPRAFNSSKWSRKSARLRRALPARRESNPIQEDFRRRELPCGDTYKPRLVRASRTNRLSIHRLRLRRQRGFAFPRGETPLRRLGERESLTNQERRQWWPIESSIRRFESEGTALFTIFVKGFVLSCCPELLW